MKVVGRRDDGSSEAASRMDDKDKGIGTKEFANLV